jgi:hypothetical protein
MDCRRGTDGKHAFSPAIEYLIVANRKSIVLGMLADSAKASGKLPIRHH